MIRFKENFTTQKCTLKISCLNWIKRYSVGDDVHYMSLVWDLVQLGLVKIWDMYFECFFVDALMVTPKHLLSV